MGVQHDADLKKGTDRQTFVLNGQIRVENNVHWLKNRSKVFKTALHIGAVTLCAYCWGGWGTPLPRPLQPTVAVYSPCPLLFILCNAFTLWSFNLNLNSNTAAKTSTTLTRAASVLFTSSSIINAIFHFLWFNANFHNICLHNEQTLLFYCVYI